MGISSLQGREGGEGRGREMSKGEREGRRREMRGEGSEKEYAVKTLERERKEEDRGKR